MSLPLVRPIEAAYGTVTERVIVVLEVTDADGNRGWAELAPVPGYSSIDADEAEERLRGGGPLPDELAAVQRDALLDLRLRTAGRSLADHLGATRMRVEATGVVGIQARPDQTIAIAGDLVDHGCRHLRVKVSPAVFVTHVKALIDTFPTVAVSADANQSFAAAPELLDAWDGIGLAAIEQPLSADDVAGHCRLRSRLDTDVALDESVASLPALEQLLEAGAADVICVKPSRLGGIENGQRAHDLCLSAGVDAFVGGMYDSSLGRSALAALAALPGFTWAGDVGPPTRYLAADVAAYPEMDQDGCVAVWAGPGSGPEPQFER